MLVRRRGQERAQVLLEPGRQVGDAAQRRLEVVRGHVGELVQLAVGALERAVELAQRDLGGQGLLVQARVLDDRRRHLRQVAQDAQVLVAEAARAAGQHDRAYLPAVASAQRRHQLRARGRGFRPLAGGLRALAGGPGLALGHAGDRVMRVQDGAGAVGHGLQHCVERNSRVHGQGRVGQPLQLLAVAPLARQQAGALLLGPLALDAQRDRVGDGAEHVEAVARQRLAREHRHHADTPVAQQQRVAGERHQALARRPGAVGHATVAGRVVGQEGPAMLRDETDLALADPDAPVLAVQVG